MTRDYFGIAVALARREFQMECKGCGRWAPACPETGYDADDLCPACREVEENAPEQCPRCITGICPPGDKYCVSCQWKDQQFQKATRGAA